MDDILRIYVDEDGRPVVEGDPRTARVLVGNDAAEAIAKYGEPKPAQNQPKIEDNSPQQFPRRGRPPKSE